MNLELISTLINVYQDGEGKKKLSLLILQELLAEVKSLGKN